MQSLEIELSQLIKTVKDAYEGYTIAADMLAELHPVAQKLSLWADERKVMFAQLNKIHHQRYQAVVREDTLIGALHRTLMEMTSVLESPTLILEQCIRGERLCIFEYEKFLTLHWAELSAEEQQLLSHHSQQIETCLHGLNDFIRQRRGGETR
jgi:hypothetical protein